MNLDSYQALRNRAATIPLEGRGFIRLGDEDRVRLLHAMCTNAIDHLQPGEGTKALLLNDKGRILAEFAVLCRSCDLLLDTEAATRELVLNHLDHYIIMDMVELEDLSDQWRVMGLEGPLAADLLVAMGPALPSVDFGHLPWEDAILANNSFTGGPGYRLYTPVASAAGWTRRLRDAGFAACDEATADVVRMEYGRPRHGVEYSVQHLVHEALLLDYISFTKGCYLGQEIVERVRSRGNVNRLLARLVLNSNEIPVPETSVMVAGAECGKVLSAAYSPALGKTIVWALLRAEQAQAGSSLHILGAEATLASPGRLA